MEGEGAEQPPAQNVEGRLPLPHYTAISRGVARILGKGGAEYAREARAQILATPTYEMERSKFKLSQRTRSDDS